MPERARAAGDGSQSQIYTLAAAIESSDFGWRIRSDCLELGPLQRFLLSALAGTKHFADTDVGREQDLFHARFGIFQYTRLVEVEYFPTGVG